MTQTETAMDQQALDSEQRKLANLERFKKDLETLQAAEAEQVRDAAASGGMSAYAATERSTRANGASFWLAPERVPAWIEAQKKRVEASEQRLAAAVARAKEAGEAQAAQHRRLVEAMVTPAPAAPAPEPTGKARVAAAR